jgi:hypothetical protein
VGFDGLEIRHASRDDSGSVSSATELEVPFPLSVINLRHGPHRKPLLFLYRRVTTQLPSNKV